MPWLSLLIDLCVLLLIAALVYLLISGQKVVHAKPLPSFDAEWGDGVITLPAAEQTAWPGRYGLWLDHLEPAGHLRIGDVLSADGERVTRVLEAVWNAPERGSGPARWSGHIFPNADAQAPGRVTDTIVEAPAGPCPAWLIAAPGAGAAASAATPFDASTWGIHVHGHGSTRVTALRSVAVADSLGMTSLVPSFRGDGEGPAQRASTLGTAESEDVAAAIDFAVARGAERVVLFLWSMGGAAGSLAAVRSPHRARIAAVVGLAPVVSWGEVIRFGARRSHLPELLGSFTAWGLGQRWLAPMLGMPAPAGIRTLTAAAAELGATTPFLIVHSALDPLVPFAAAEAFAAAHPEHVELARFETAGHTLEANAAPDAFARALTDWLAAAIAPRAGEPR